MNKEAYYFSHDSNAQDDPKIMILIDQLGMEGYGIFWCLIEKLRCEKDYKLPISITNSYARRWGTSKEKVDTVIFKYDLFVIEEHKFFSLRLLCSMEMKSEKARISANKRWDAVAMRTHSDSNATAMLENAKESKVKESKVKEIKLKESKESKESKENEIFSTPTKNEVIEFFKTTQYPEQAEQFYDYYESNGWKVAKNKMKNWKAAAKNWIRNQLKYETNQRTFQRPAKTTIYEVQKINNDYFGEIGKLTGAEFVEYNRQRENAAD